MALVIEIVTRSGKVLERHSFTSPSVSVGRGYDNDLILSDQYASARHVNIDLVDESIVIDAGPEPNGQTYIAKKRFESGIQKVNSGDEIIIGRTHLRIFTRDHPVPPPASTNLVDRVFGYLSRPYILAALFVVFLGLFFLETYLTSWRELKYPELGVGVLSFSFMLLVWAAIWAIIGYVVKSEARFFQQLAVVISFAILMIFIELPMAVVSFNLGSLSIASVLDYLLQGVVLACLLTVNMHIALQQTRLRRQLIAHGVAWSFIGFIILSEFAYQPEFSRRPEFNSQLLPQSLLFRKTVDREDYTSSLGEAFEFDAEALSDEN